MNWRCYWLWLIGIIKCYLSSLTYFLHYRFLVCVELLQPNYDYSFTFITKSNSPLHRSILFDSLFPLFPWTSLVCVEFSDFPRSFSTSKSQISSTTNNTNCSHKQKIQVNAKLDRWFHHSFLFAPFHSHSRSDFTILSQVTFKQQLWFCTNYVVLHFFFTFWITF